jgi:hypothetical protein
VGPRASLDSMEKRKSCPTGNRTPAVQPVAIPNELSRLTNQNTEVQVFEDIKISCSIKSLFDSGHYVSKFSFDIIAIININCALFGHCSEHNAVLDLNTLFFIITTNGFI